MAEKTNEVSCEIKKTPVEIGLIVTGSDVEKNIIITKAEMQAIGRGENTEFPLTETRTFSTYDKHGDNSSKSIRKGKGIDINLLLEKAGAKDADEIKFKSIDNFETTITEYTSEKHYFYPNIHEGNAEGYEEVSAIIAFYSDESIVKFFPHPNLMLGQKGLEDKNKDFFAKGIKAITIGNKKNIFYVNGCGVNRKRNFTLLQLLEMFNSKQDSTDKAIYPLKMQEAIITYNNPEAGGKSTVFVRGISLEIILNYMGIKENDTTTENFKVAFNSDNSMGNSKADISVKDLFNPKSNFFLSFDEEDGGLNLYGNLFELKDVKGISIGEVVKPTIVNDIGKKPNIYSNDSEFFIYVKDSKGSGNFYYYTVDELIEKYGESNKPILQEFSFYNHNMDNGKGGNRKVTAKGFYFKKLLEDISELGGVDSILNETMTMQVCSMDGYRASNQLDMSEVYDYNYFLSYEIDQRTETGLEPNDSSKWKDNTYKFIPAEDETRFRMYCNKGSANPSIYTKIIGVAISTVGEKVEMGDNGENCGYKVAYVNEEGKEIKNCKTVKSCIPGLQVSECNLDIRNCKLSDSIKKTITLLKGENNKIEFKYIENCYLYVKYSFKDENAIKYYTYTDLKEKEWFEIETEEYKEGIWNFKSILTKIKLRNILSEEIADDCICQLVKNDGNFIQINNIDDYYIVIDEIKKKAAGKLSYNIEYKLPTIAKGTAFPSTDMFKDIEGIIIRNSIL